MNTVSKLLIVLQLVLSIVFMAFAAAVYQTGNNWKKIAMDNEQSIRDGQANLNAALKSREEEKEEYNAKVDELTQTSQNYLAQSVAYKTELDQLNGVQGGEGELSKIKIERDVATAEAKVATEEARSRLAEAKALREVERILRSQVDKLVAESRKKDDSLLELSRFKASAVAKDTVDQDTIGRLSAIIRLNGLNPRTKVDPNGKLVAEGREPVELVNGKVLSSKRNGRIEYVSVSLGQDDAIEVGNKLHIYRGSKFIADIIIREVYSDRAVGTVYEPVRNGVIQRDDNVTSRL